MHKACLDESGVRVKFALERVRGPSEGSDAWRELSAALVEMARLSCTPLTPDGRTTGNIALRLKNGILVSKSGRGSLAPGPQDFVTVLDFDCKRWLARYASAGEDIVPSSDTPLYWAALVTVPQTAGWRQRPGAALHGHLLSSQRAADDLGVPISKAELAFSTPEEKADFSALLTTYPYPANHTYIRRNHGFFTLGRDVMEIMGRMGDLMQRAAALGLTRG